MDYPVEKKTLLRPAQRPSTDLSELRAAFPAGKIDETLTPNLRALRLAMTACDLLLSMGVSANSAVSRGLDITEAYCDQPVNITISFNLLTLSQVRGLESEPLTIVRPVPMRDINNIAVQAVQHLIYEIRTCKVSLARAEARFDKILTHPESYPAWLPPLATVAIAPTVILMYTTDWRVILVTAVAALFVNRILSVLGRKLIAPFFRQVVASAFVTLIAAAIAWLGHEKIGFFVGLHPTLIVVGGIFLLISGLAIVGAVQDAIEEYYLTATARLLRVLMLTSGIVLGILAGTYVARKAGFGIAVSPNPLPLSQLQFQILGGGLAAAAQALATQTRLRAVAWAGIVGGGALATMYASTHLGISIIPASGVAALFVGLVASLFSRRWHTPASGIIACGILPLVPGVTLYTGLMQLVSYPPGHPLFLHGIGTLFTTITAALAIATGASLGSLMGRPLHRHITHERNITPFMQFMREQLHADRKAMRLATFIPRHLIKREKAE